MGGTPALQNGRHGDTEGITKGERLDGESRPQRCLLYNSNTCRSPTLPDVHGGTRTLSVYLSTILSIMSTMDTHQSDETCCNLSSCHGGTNDSLHRRQSSDDGHSSSGGKSPRSTDVLLTGLVFIINVPKSVTTPAQQIGLKVDSTSIKLSFPGEKLHHIWMEVSQHLQRSQLTAQQLVQLIGKLHAASQAVLPAPLYYW